MFSSVQCYGILDNVTIPLDVHLMPGAYSQAHVGSGDAENFGFHWAGETRSSNNPFG